MATEKDNSTEGQPRGASGWQDTMQTMLGGQAQSWRRMAEATAGAGLRWLGSPEARQSASKLATEFRELTVAEWAVASEWLRAPLWISGGASPRDLRQRYARVVEAERDLVRSMLDAAASFQQTASSAIHEASESGRPASQPAASPAPPSPTSSAGAAHATVEAPQGIRGAAATSSTEAPAPAAAQPAATIAAQTPNAERTPRSRQSGTPAAGGAVKGNINSKGERLYHLPGDQNYEAVKPEQTFATEDEARAAGFHHAPR